jgi:P27 family predicted phage terminase small subunit
MAKRKTERQWRNDIIGKMKAVGTYHESYDHAINVLARTLLEYDVASEELEASGMELTIEYTNKGGATNFVKNPAYQVVEKMRDDIITYSRELGLTPAGLKRINEQGMKPQKISKFEELLSGATQARKGS